MKRLKSYFFTNTNLNSRGKYISLKDNAEPNETLFSDLLDSVVKPKVGADYQDQADYNAVNTKDSTKFTTAENLPEVDTTGSLLTITTTAAVDTNLLRRKKYTVSVNTPSSISDISSRLTTKLVTPANLPKFALDNSEYTQVASQLPYFAPSVVVTTDGVDFYQTYSLKLRALESTMMTHAGVRLDSVLDSLRTDVNACVSDAELASAVSTLNTAIGLKANKVTPTFVTGYNGTKVVVNSQGVVTSVSKASALDITNDSSVSGSTVKDALNWLKANGGGTGGASDTDGVTNLSAVAGATATDALNNLSVSIAAIVPFISSDVEINSSNTSGWTTPTFNVSPLVNYRVAAQSANIELVLPSYVSADLNKVILVYKGFDDTRVTTFTGYPVILSKKGDCVGFICTTVGWLPFTTSIDSSADLALKANIHSPTFTGTPSAPTATSGTNTTQIATTAFVTSAISTIPSYTGTANRITVSSGVIDIASTYVGQTSITTLGTIGAGTWQGTAIADAYIASAATWNAKLGVSGGTLTGALNYAPAVTLASSSTVNIGSANSNNVDISGSTTITAFDSVADGIIRYVRFTGALTLVHNVTTLRLPNSKTITTQNGDTAIFRSLGSGNWICVSYKSANVSLNSTTSDTTITNAPLYVNSSNANGTLFQYWSNASSTLNFEYLSSTTWNWFTSNAKLSWGCVNSMYWTLRNTTGTFSWGNDTATSAIIKTQESATTMILRNSLVVGGGSSMANANTVCSLDLQANDKGLGLNLVAGNLGTTRNGLLWYDSTNNLFKGIQSAGFVTFATTANTNLTVQFGWKNTYSANTALYQMLNDTGSTKWIAVDACSIYALTLNFGTAPTSAYQVFYNKNGAGWTSFNTTDTAANTADVSIKPSTAITMAANDTIQFRLNQGADGISMNVIIKS